MTRGQGLLPWIADNPNIQARCILRRAEAGDSTSTPVQAATLMAGVSRPAVLPFATQLHEGRFDKMRVWDPRDAAALRLQLSKFDIIGVSRVLTLKCAIHDVHLPHM